MKEVETLIHEVGMGPTISTAFEGAVQRFEHQNRVAEHVLEYRTLDHNVTKDEKGFYVVTILASVITRREEDL